MDCSENSEDTQVSQEFALTSRRGSVASQESFEAIISNSNFKGIRSEISLKSSIDSKFFAMMQ